MRCCSLASVLGTAAALADEGMWPLQLLPTAAVRQQYGVDLTPEWLTRVRDASVRLANCSATFVSADGLLLTNQHCVRNCLAEHSSRRQNLISDGFLAPSREREPPCSSQVADVLLDTEDVTAAIDAATRNLEARAANAARKKTLHASGAGLRGAVADHGSAGADPLRNRRALRRWAVLHLPLPALFRSAPGVRAGTGARRLRR